MSLCQRLFRVITKLFSLESLFLGRLSLFLPSGHRRTVLRRFADGPLIIGGPPLRGPLIFGPPNGIRVSVGVSGGRGAPLDVDETLGFELLRCLPHSAFRKAGAIRQAGRADLLLRFLPANGQSKYSNQYLDFRSAKITKMLVIERVGKRCPMGRLIPAESLEGIGRGSASGLSGFRFLGA